MKNLRTKIELTVFGLYAIGLSLSVLTKFIGFIYLPVLALPISFLFSEKEKE